MAGLLIAAVDRLYEKDKELLSLSGTERSCAFRIGVYLHDILPKSPFAELNLDMEYNKNADGEKNLYYQGKDRGIRPDLLLHKRGIPDHNMLVAEFKVKGATRTDIDKLKALTSPAGAYRYRLGSFVMLEEKASSFQFFAGGKEIPYP